VCLCVEGGASVFAKGDGCYTFKLGHYPILRFTL
jgi:hypothetical protein